MLYNKEIFNECGVEVPQNMEMFWDACEKIKDHGYTPLASSFKEEWTIGIWLALMGSKAGEEIEGFYEKLNSNEIGFSDSGVYLQFIKDLKETYDRGFMGLKSLNAIAREAFLDVFDGTAAMALSNCTPEVWLADSKLTIDKESFGMFPAPFADNRYVTIYKGGVIRVINKISEHIEECLDYFNFLAEEENLDIYYAAPERMYVSPSFEEYVKRKAQSPFEEELNANSEGGAEVIGETGILYWDNTMLGHYVLQAVLGAITPEEALESIDAFRRKQFEAEG